jgi:hypothetical protein
MPLRARFTPALMRGKSDGERVTTPMARRRSFYGLTLCMLQKLEFHRGASIPGLETNKGVRPHPRAKAALTRATPRIHALVRIKVLAI